MPAAAALGACPTMQVAAGSVAIANPIPSAQIVANRIFLTAASIDRWSCRFLPDATIVRKKRSDFSEVRHTRTMIFATRNV